MPPAIGNTKTLLATFTIDLAANADGTNSYLYIAAGHRGDFPWSGGPGHGSYDADVQQPETMLTVMNNVFQSRGVNNTTFGSPNVEVAGLPLVAVDGACCDFLGIPGLCLDGFDEFACESAGGTFRGSGTTCADDGCTAACCLPGDTCEELFPADCSAAGGEFQGFDVDCASNPCDDCVLPTEPADPDPPDGATDVLLDANLAWNGGVGAQIRYVSVFQTNEPGLNVAGDPDESGEGSMIGQVPRPYFQNAESCADFGHPTLNPVLASCCCLDLFGAGQRPKKPKKIVIIAAL